MHTARDMGAEGVTACYSILIILMARKLPTNSRWRMVTRLISWLKRGRDSQTVMILLKAIPKMIRHRLFMGILTYLYFLSSLIQTLLLMQCISSTSHAPCTSFCGLPGLLWTKSQRVRFSCGSNLVFSVLRFQQLTIHFFFSLAVSQTHVCSFAVSHLFFSSMSAIIYFLILVFNVYNNI